MPRRLAISRWTSWIQAHVHAFEFYGGVPSLIVPDNARTGVTRACRYDPDLNPTYQEMAMHYGVGVVPARPYKPRDKAKVESGVLLAERWVIAALRHRRFHDLAELNQAIRELLVRLNDRAFRKRDGSRSSVFRGGRSAGTPGFAHRAIRSEPVVACQSQHRLSPFIRRKCLQRAVHSDCANWSRCGQRPRPSRYSTRASAWPRICAPARTGTAVTNSEHRPDLTRRIWNGRHRGWCIGRSPSAHIQPRLFERILADKPHPEMGYRGCLGIIRLAAQYSRRAWKPLPSGRCSPERAATRA